MGTHWALKKRLSLFSLSDVEFLHLVVTRTGICHSHSQFHSKKRKKMHSMWFFGTPQSLSQKIRSQPMLYTSRSQEASSITTPQHLLCCPFCFLIGGHFWEGSTRVRTGNKRAPWEGRIEHKSWALSLQFLSPWEPVSH